MWRSIHRKAVARSGNPKLEVMRKRLTDLANPTATRGVAVIVAVRCKPATLLRFKRFLVISYRRRQST